MRVWNYIVIMITMIIFLNAVGFKTPGTDSLMHNLSISVNSSDPEVPISSGFSFSPFFLSVVGIIGAVSVGGAILVGLFTHTFDWKLVLLVPMLFTAGAFFVTGYSIMQLAVDSGETWLVLVIGTIFVPLLVGFGFSIIEWFGGSD